MTETSTIRLWTMRAAFTGVALLILLGNLLPLQTTPRSWAAPDLLFCFAMVWSVRRPDFVPLPLLAGLFLLADLLLSRPPGLAAALMLLACHDLQAHMRQLRSASFLAEWLRAAILIVAAMIGARLILIVLLVPVPPLSLTAFQIGVTILSYPLVVAVSLLIFGVRRSGPGDLDSYGQRL